MRMNDDDVHDVDGEDDDENDDDDVHDVDGLSGHVNGNTNMENQQSIVLEGRFKVFTQ